MFSVSFCGFWCGCFGPWNLILVNSLGFAFWRRSGALYFEGLRGLNLVNSRRFAFLRRSRHGSRRCSQGQIGNKTNTKQIKLQSANPREFTRIRLLRLRKTQQNIKLQSASRTQTPVNSRGLGETAPQNLTRDRPNRPYK